MKNIPSSGGKGERATMQALQDWGLRYNWQVPVNSKFAVYTYIVDFVVWRPETPNKRVALEIQGGFHRKTWGGRVAHTRKRKDRAKRNCLVQEGFIFCEWRDDEILHHPEVCKERLYKALDAPTGSMFLEPKNEDADNQ